MSSFVKFVFVISCFALVLSSCGGAEERKAAYLEKGKASMAAGNYDKARIELKNVLQIDPKDSKARFYLGQIHERQKSYRKAFRSYTKVAELTPDNFENQAKLGQFHLLLGRDKVKAKEKVDLILGKDSDNPYGLFLKAAILAFDNQIDEAIKISEGLFKENVDFIENSIFLSTLYLKTENTNKAISVLEKTLVNNEGNEKITSALGKLLLVTKDYDRAEKIYKDKLARHPDVYSGYANLAAFYNIKGDKEQAIQVLRDAIENNPEDVDRQITLVKYLRTTKGDDVAVNELKSLISADASLGKLRVALAGLYVSTGELDKAKKAFMKAIEDFSEDATGVESRTALAALYLSEGDTDKAKAILREAIAVSPNDSKVNLLLAKLAIKDEDYDNAVIALRIVIKEAPENLEAYFLMASVHNKLEQTEQAKAIINTAYENNRANPDALLKLSKYYVSVNDPVKAEKIIDDFIAINDSDYEALSIKAALLGKAKKYEEAEKVAKWLVTKFPDKANGYVQSVQYLTNAQKNDDALVLLEEGYKNVEDNRLILKMLVSLQVASGKTEEAEKLINSELESSKDDVELHTLLAKLYFVNKDMVKAKAELNNIIKMKPDEAESYLLLSSIYNQEGNKDDVLNTLQDGHRNVTKGNVKLSLALARIYEGDENYKDAVDVYEDMLVSNSENLIATNNLASILSDRYTDESSLLRAKELADKMKDAKQPVILDTVGWVYYKTKNYVEAVNTLKKVVAEEPAINIFNYHLGMAYLATEDKVNAKLHLEKSLADGKQFDGKAEAEEALKTL